MADAGTRRRFTIDEYHRMGEAGILGDDERLELIAGHAIVRVQNPVVLPHEASEIQPDIMLLAPRADFYTAAHPTPADVLLLIEVADISLLLDRRVKMPLYGRAGIQEAWLCELTTGRVDVHRDVTGGRYATVRTYTTAQSLSAQAFADIAVSVAELLGPAD